ncbi:MAG TPA: hypothetical protein VFH73_15555 [Polyangia bacterium]|nr:hypothetical protein [Polyangia bacterium]
MLALVLPVMAVSAAAYGSLVMALDLPALVAKSDHIAVADVLSVRAAWDERHERIESTIELAVVETWKGAMAPASHLTIVQAGGTVGDITMVVFGMSQFKAGERSLIFARGPVSSASVVGMSQGKRPLRREDPTGRWIVDGPDTSGVKLVRPQPQVSPATPVPPALVRARPLEELRDEVRGILKARQ